jgi:hypothetical protein
MGKRIYSCPLNSHLTQVLMRLVVQVLVHRPAIIRLLSFLFPVRGPYGSPAVTGL